MFIFYIYVLKAPKDSASVRILIKTACAKKTARKTIAYDRIMKLQEARKYGRVTRNFVVITVIIGHHTVAECIGYEN